MKEYEDEETTEESEEKIRANIDININKDILAEYELPTLSELAISKDKDYWIKTRKEVTKDLKNCTRNINKYSKEEPDKKIEFKDAEPMAAGEYVSELELDRKKS